MSGLDERSEARITEWIAAMTLEEKVALVAGADMWRTVGVPRLGIPPFKVTDGPAGARGESFSEGPPSDCFPCGTALGATWDPALVEEVGAALGEETRTKGAHVLLAPTVNIHRSPLAGRNFECFSEDPHLTARLAVAYVRGVQSRGVGCSIKHFVCNDSEFERHTISSDVGERPLREIYLRPFEEAVAEARPWSVMSAYNKVNGTWASESRALLVDLLKEDWGFDGFVVSDWFGTNATVPCALGGLDLEMPGAGRHFGPALLDAVRKDEVDEETLDDKVRRVLRATIRSGAIDEASPRPEGSEDRPAHRALARRAARDAMVLLRNEGDVLPLDPDALRSLAVIGPNANTAVIQGGGSVRLNAHAAVTPLDGIRERLGDGAAVRFEIGCTRHRTLPLLTSRHLEDLPGAAGRGLRVEYFASLDLSGEPVARAEGTRVDYSWFGPPAEGVDARSFSARISARFVPPESGEFQFGLMSAGLSRLLVDGEPVVDNWTRQERGDSFFGAGSSEAIGRVALRQGEPVTLAIEYTREGAGLLAGLRAGMMLPVADDALERAAAAAAEADAAVVVVGLDADWETEGRDRVDLELPGRQAELIEAVAAANPRTVVVLNVGSPVRMPWAERVPALLQAWYPGQEWGHALAELLFGDASPSARLPTSFPHRLEDTPSFLNYPGENGHVLYGEGLFVGYRYYDTVDVAPLFPFGHGLSYARFDYANLSLAPEFDADGGLDVALDVTNAGDRAASEVVQLYLQDVESRLTRPAQELAAFAKVALEPGETRTVRLYLDRRAFSYWDPDAGGWLAEPGEFEVRVGASSRDLRLRARTTLRARADG